MITVFTATYNRAYIIDKLYDSLCGQTINNFEWLIVDDGSVDNTENLILSFIKENKIKIRYFKQINGGKHRAINKGVKEARGELFFIVDSDDHLVNNSIERAFFYYNQIKRNISFAGISGVRSYFSGEKVGGESDFEILDCTLLDFRYKYEVHGDLAEIYKTEILKKFPFPEIEGEFFCPEALVWYKIAERYRLRFFNEKIYMCEYLPDGLTSKILQVRQESPIGSMMTYLEVYKSKVPIRKKIKSAISYWRFYFYSRQDLLKRIVSIGLIGFFFLPLGYVIYQIDKYKHL